MNVNLAPFMILMPAALAIGQVNLSSDPLSRQESQLNGRSWAHVTGRDYGDDESVGPFTREEARQMRSVWSTIREAANFYDIDWRAMGLARAPGNREARRFMAEDWGSLRRAEQFDDIDWRAEYHRR